MDSIDLGRKSPEPIGMPEMPTKTSEPSVHYPTLYIDGDASLMKLPDSGVMEVAFKVCSRNVTTRDSKTTCCVCLDVTKILEVEADVSTGEKESASDVLDKLAKEIEEDSDEE